MQYVVIIYLWLSILLYAILGGADFGTGIIELLTPEKYRSVARNTMYKAISPIWEANHMWLIIAVVILFVGFPATYTNITTYLHIPLLMMLLGIIARGTALSFRNYDAVIDKMQRLYTCIFISSSFVSPFFLGVIAGSLISGKAYSQGNDFAEVYIYNWLNWFSVAVGFFVVCLFGFIAAIFLIAQTGSRIERKRTISLTWKMNVLVLLAAILICMSVKFLHVLPFLNAFDFTTGLLITGCTLVCLLALWYSVIKKSVMGPRILTGLLITVIFLAVIYGTSFKTGVYTGLMKGKANDGVVKLLGSALLIGSLFILPPLFYLFYVFSKEKNIPAKVSS